MFSFLCTTIIKSNWQKYKNLNDTCMSWSDSNMIALSYPLNYESNFPIFIIDPNSPYEHQFVYTPSPVIQLEWAPNNFNNLLLSLTNDDNIYVWKMKDNCINMYEISSTIYVESCIAVKWANNI